MKVYTSKDILKLLIRDGWYIKHQVGSHLQLAHSTKKGKVTLPHPKKELAIGTLKSILKQANLTEGDLV